MLPCLIPALRHNSLWCPVVLHLSSALNACGGCLIITAPSELLLNWFSPEER